MHNNALSLYQVTRTYVHMDKSVRVSELISVCDGSGDDLISMLGGSSLCSALTTPMSALRIGGLLTELTV